MAIRAGGSDPDSRVPILVSGAAPAQAFRGDMVMFDVNGGIWTCGLDVPVSSRHWVSLGNMDLLESMPVAMASCTTPTNTWLAVVLADGRVEVNSYDSMHWNGWANYIGITARNVHAFYDGATTWLVAVGTDGAGYWCSLPAGGRWGSWAKIT